jgi:hydroxyquinol 1,2-dioxygenase
MPGTGAGPPEEEAMREFTEETLTDAVVARLARTENARFKEVMTALIRHLHALVREVELTEAEWAAAIRFLTATGQASVGDRQEFILLSDVLGVSMLVDAVNHRGGRGVTQSTVLGPFYIEGAPDLPMGSDISHGGPGEPTEVSGRVLTPDGKPIKDAVLDVWQTAPNGFYSTQDPNQDRFNLRGRFRTDAGGAYFFRTIKPTSYPVPTDGPVGTILNAMGRHPMRPAHLHFIVSAPGYETVTTHLFVDGDPYLDSDVVFGVKNSLIIDFTPKPGGKTLEATYDFGLKPAA